MSTDSPHSRESGNPRSAPGLDSRLRGNDGSAAPLLDVYVARKRFGDKTVLRDVRLQLDAGEVVTLVGASGCGKSTLLRVVAGLDPDYEGAVSMRGELLTGPTRDIRFVFQEPRLFPWLTVARNVAFDLEGEGDVSAAIDDLLREVGLEGLGNALPKQLSGGQAQRVAIARGLFVRPSLLLLDEPFSAVDAFTRIKLQDLLLTLARTHGVTVLMVTHDIGEAVHLSDRVLVLEADPGRLREQVHIPLARPRARDDAQSALLTQRVRRALQAAHAF